MAGTGEAAAAAAAVPMGKDAMLNRRRLLLGATASAAAAALPALPPPAARRRARPSATRRAPAWYRFRIGEFEATVVSDGALPLGDPRPDFPAVAAGGDRVPACATTSCRRTRRPWSRTCWW